MKITYVALEKDIIEKETEKAFGVFDRWADTKDGFQKAIYKYIPKSMTIAKNEKIYVNNFLVSENSLYDYVDNNDKMVIENNVKKATGKDLIIKKLNKELKNRTNQALILYDTKQFEEIAFCEEFDFYKNDRGYSKFKNYDKYGIVAIFELNENNKIINTLIQDENIINNLNKLQKEYLNTTIKELQ